MDLCPLISTSVIDPYTGGYTDNVDNAGTELQVHLILKVDPRVITHMGPCDLFSPAKRAISKYLNNTDGRHTMAQYFTNNLETLQSPEELIIETHTNPKAWGGLTTSPFNEVVVCGNYYANFFKKTQPIEILGIGLSSYWINRRSKPNEIDIKSLKHLGKIIPLIYYEPETSRDAYSNIAFRHLSTKPWLKIMQKPYGDTTASETTSCMLSNSFFERKPYLERFYQQVCQTIGTQEEISILLPMALIRADFGIVTKIIERSPRVDLNEKIKNPNLGDKIRQHIHLIDLIPTKPNAICIVQFMLNKGLNLDSIIFEWAIKCQNIEFIKYLIDCLRQTPILLKQVLLTDNSSGSIPLHSVISPYCNLDLFNTLLTAYKFDSVTLNNALSSSKTGYADNNLLHSAMRSERSDVVLAVLSAYKDNPKLLRKAAVETTTQGRKSFTPIGLGVEQFIRGSENELSTLDALLMTYTQDRKLMETLNDKNGQSDNFFHKGARSNLELTEKFLKVYQNYEDLLQEALSSQGEIQSTPIKIAIKNKNIEVAFMLHRATKTEDPVLVRKLIHQGIKLENLEALDMLLTHYQRYPVLLKEILSVRNIKKWTLFHEAVLGKEIFIFNKMNAVYQKLCPGLLDSIMSVDINHECDNFFHLAAWNKNIEIFNALIGIYKINPEYLKSILSKRNQNYDAPLSIAEEVKNEEMVSIIKTLM